MSKKNKLIKLLYIFFINDNRKVKIFYILKLNEDNLVFCPLVKKKSSGFLREYSIY